MLAVDICAFGDHRHDDPVQCLLRRQMYEHLRRACEFAVLPWRRCHHEDRGDGVLIVAPADLPVERLFEPLAHHLATALWRYNRNAADSTRLRMRLAVHSGLVAPDPYGVSGRALIELFRLLDARAFKNVVARSRRPLGVILSERFYADARTCGGLADADAYHAIRVRTKEARIPAQVRTDLGTFD
ncbi:hypothetical protein E1200_28215 [Actinomadura sp. GC306]|uniref:hypothetical protein n=1 Tax=Actinomadura sp. GC306 TaxID=2530367 RepID=UPI001052993A|nr:hypothetical protein [Actinomadura sp. GC306]TDC61758.1 hypothetical protein E1200_28215 [Actinomadura sp. GC306]